jgi:polygalacturonase
MTCIHLNNFQLSITQGGNASQYIAHAGDYNIANNDGLDIDSCSDVLVEDLDVQTADDAICLKTSQAGVDLENVTVRKCVLASRSSAIKFGSESHGNFQNITIENIEV